MFENKLFQPRRFNRGNPWRR